MGFGKAQLIKLVREGLTCSKDLSGIHLSDNFINSDKELKDTILDYFGTEDLDIGSNCVLNHHKNNRLVVNP